MQTSPIITVGVSPVWDRACYVDGIEWGDHQARHEVGCGDYLLAGDVALPVTADIGQKLATGIRVATARAWGWSGVKPWPQVRKEIEVETIVF